MAESVIIVGLGAQAKYALEIFDRMGNIQIEGLVDIEESRKSREDNKFGYPVYGGLDKIEEESVRKRAEKAIVCCADTALKQRLTEYVRENGFDLINAIHPASVVAGTSKIGKGVIINAGAVIQPYAQIGDGVMIHANVVVEHDNRIGDFANLAPGASLSGWVTVQARATVYTGASIIPGVTIGSDAVVGAGAVVLKDVPERSVVVGVPARVIKSRDGI